jgi:hypothetical protein
MCVYIHSRFIENHPIRILEDGPLIFEGVLSQCPHHVLKSHELSHKGHHNHDASLTCKALITSARVGGHDANPTNTVSSALEFALSSLAAAFDD